MSVPERPWIIGWKVTVAEANLAITDYDDIVEAKACCILIAVCFAATEADKRAVPAIKIPSRGVRATADSVQRRHVRILIRLVPGRQRRRAAKA
jgi:hypothetical protein